jgi:hypothetical protein
MAFTTITIAPGLDRRARRRARECGPPAVAARAEHDELLRRAGFTDVVRLDVTDAYVDTLRAWLHHRQRHATELARLGPPGAFEQRIHDQTVGLAATEAGLLRREMLSASRPT